MSEKIDVPAWFERALDPSTPTTEDQETMRTASTYVEDLGGEVIYPTIRMNKAGRLFKPKDPLKSAMKNGDYILVEGPAGEETAMKATELSKRMSAAVAKSREPVDRTDDLIKTQEDKMKSDTVSFNEGGLLDEGGSVDPVSGNDVPSGSTQSEVRDDIPAQLSEGEFVLPADVVRYIGLENLMELRNKAKQGLQQMEDMGQMGNSEEATMDDTAEMDVDIDALIDEFDPNDPETLNFAQGGAVTTTGAPVTSGTQQTYAYQPQKNIYNPAGISTQAFNYQPQQFTVGYQAPNVYTPPTVPVVNPTRYRSVTSPAGSGVPEQRQYIGPNGEMRTFTFINGVPTEEIPAGFTVYKVEEQQSPQIVKPEIAPVSQDGGDNGQDQQARDDYAGYVSEMGQLAQLDKTVDDLWSGSLHNPNNNKGIKDTLGNFIKAGGIAGAVKSDYAMHQAAQAAAPNIASTYGLDINNYKNTGLSSIFSTHNTDSLARDALTSKAVAESLGMDPRDLVRTNNNTDRDGRISEYQRKKAEADLFMDEDRVDYAKEIAKEEAERKARQDALVEQANREAAEAAQRAANKAEAERNAAKVRDSNGDGNGDGNGGGGPSDSFGGGRDSDGWGE